MFDFVAKTLARWSVRIGGPSGLGGVLLFATLVHAVGLGWGLPASDGWDNDGVAPRDFLAGLVQTLTPGHFYTYPPVHLAILFVLTLPVTAVALFKAASLSEADVVAEILKVPYMTANAYVARVVAVVMSVGIVLFVGRIAGELRAASLGVSPDDPRPRRAATCAAAFVAVNLSLTYYAHTTNLDVPYLFWGTWAVLAFVRALTRAEPRRLRFAFVLAVLAVGTKDQAYAMFAATVPAALAVWLFLAGRAPARVALVREVALAGGLAVLVLLVVDGVVLNPSGFTARLGFLTGSASRDFAHYSSDGAGKWLVVKDMVRFTPRYYPWLLAPCVALGLVSLRKERGTTLLASLLPLLVAVSFTVTFNWVARRTEHRFLLPQSIMLAVYGGLGVERLVFDARRRLRVFAQAVLAVGFAIGVFGCADVDAQFFLDPRYDAERWLRDNVRPGDTIEVHGLNVYLPRLPPNVRVIRVGPDPAENRNPLPGVTEVTDAFGRAKERGARFVVVSEGFAWRYLFDANGRMEDGRIVPKTQLASGSDADGTAFFSGLLRSTNGFRWAHHSKYESALWPRLDIHASTSRDVWIFER